MMPKLHSLNSVHVEAIKIRLLMHLRQSGITDARVLGAIETTPRERFVPDAFHDRAYADMALPIGKGQTISQPYVVAYMTQLLEVGSRHKVLEIGTGCGYQAAILSKLCRRVYTIERHKELSTDAIERLKDLSVRNFTALTGDGTNGWPAQAPFDRIIVTAAAPHYPPNQLVDQLSPDGGIMVIPVYKGKEKGTIMVRLTKQGDQIAQEETIPVRFVPLISDDQDDNTN